MNLLWNHQRVAGIQAAIPFFVFNLPVVFFSAAPVYSGQPVIFNNESEADSVLSSWLWDFGNGSAGTNFNAVHVNLIAISEFG